MKNLKLNLNLIFSNEDLPVGMNFNEEINSLSSWILNSLQSLVNLQTGIESSAIMDFNTFNTSNKAQQSFLVNVFVSEKTFFSMKVKGTITDASGAVHTFLEEKKYQINGATWFNGFSVVENNAVSIETEKQSIAHQKSEVKEDSTKVVLEPVSILDTESVKAAIAKAAPEQISIPDTNVGNSFIRDDHPYYKVLQHHCEEVEAAVERYKIPEELISSHCKINTAKVKILINGHNENKRLTLKEAEELIAEALIIKTAISELAELAKKQVPAKSGGNEHKGNLVELPKPEKENPEIVRKRGFMETAERYINLIKTYVSEETDVNKLLARYDISSHFVYSCQNLCNFSDFTEGTILKQLENIREAYNFVTRMQQIAKEKESDPRYDLFKKVNDILNSDILSGYNIQEKSEILGSNTNYIYKFRNGKIDGFSIDNCKRLVTEIEFRFNKFKENKLKKEIEEKRKETEKINIKKQLQQETLKLQKKEPSKILEEARAVITAMKLTIGEISEITGIDDQTVLNICQGSLSKINPDQAETILELVRLGAEENEKRKAKQQSSKVHGLQNLTDLKGLVKKSQHPSGVNITKFTKEFYGTADTELRARYGKNSMLLNTTVVSKHFNENRKRLLVISKNPVEIANYTGIDSTLINRSMKHGSMIGGRDIYAIHLYLNSIAGELEQIKNAAEA